MKEDAMDPVLSALQHELTRRFGSAFHYRVQCDALVLVCDQSGASIGITVDDPVRPSFCVSYPGFDADAASWKELRERTARRVLLEGIVWIARAVVKDGAVLPEFATPSLRHSARRAHGRS